jgi:tetratricopeptide (TPR) repeat protein
MKKNFPSPSVPALGLLVLLGHLALYVGPAGAAIREVPSSLDWHYAIAETYVKLKDYASARAVLRQALETNPGAAALHFHLAELCRAAGDKPQAAAAYARGLEADPADTRAPFRLASLHMEMGNPLPALSVLKKAAGREAVRRESLMEMARIYCAMGQDWPALDCYLRAADLGEERAVTGMLNVGKRLFDQGRVDRAREVFALIRTAFPKDLEVRQALADSLDIPGKPPLFKALWNFPKPSVIADWKPL